MLLQKPWPRIVQANVEVWIYTIHDVQDYNTSRSDSFKRFSLPSVSDSVFSQELSSAYYASTYSATQHSRDISRILAQPKYFILTFLCQSTPPNGLAPLLAESS